MRFSATFIELALLCEGAVELEEVAPSFTYCWDEDGECYACGLAFIFDVDVQQPMIVSKTIDLVIS